MGAVSYNWFLIRHGDGHRGSEGHSGSHINRVRDNPLIVSTKSMASTVTRSPQLGWVMR